MGYFNDYKHAFVKQSRLKPVALVIFVLKSLIFLLLLLVAISGLQYLIFVVSPLRDYATVQMVSYSGIVGSAIAFAATILPAFLYALKVTAR